MRFVAPLAGMATEVQVRTTWAALNDVLEDCTIEVLRPLRDENYLHPIMLQIVVEGVNGRNGDPANAEEVEIANTLFHLGWRQIH